MNNQRYFDVSFIIYVDGYEKYGFARLPAEDEQDAIVQAIKGEAHNLTDIEVVAQFENDDPNIDDGDFLYGDFTAVELFPTPITIHGVSKTILAPAPDVSAHIGYGKYYV